MNTPQQLRKEAREAFAKAIHYVTANVTDGVKARAINQALDAMVEHTIAVATERHNTNKRSRPNARP